MYFSPVLNISLFTKTVILLVGLRLQRTPGKMLGDIGEDWTKNSGGRSLSRGTPSTDKIQQGVPNGAKQQKHLTGYTGVRDEMTYPMLLTMFFWKNVHMYIYGGMKEGIKGRGYNINEGRRRKVR